MTEWRFDGLYIDGEWQGESDRAPVINPATEEEIATAPVGGAKSADAALAAARLAFDEGPWPRFSPKERQALMGKFYDEMKARAADIVRLIVAECGAPLALAQGLHFGISMSHFAFAVDAAGREMTTPLPIAITPSRTGEKVLGAAVTVREPFGVVSAITPFNFPFFLNLAKIGPALAMGNTMVLKPSPLTPLQALIVAEAAHAAGLPPGVFNVVTGGVDVGEMLTTDPRVDLVTFTGSDLVGAAVMGQAAPGLKRVLLELGGKSAMIVRQDADLDAAVPAGLANFTIQAGQGCALCTRHIVHNSVKADYVQRLTAMAGHIKVGDPADSSVTMGPLIGAAQRARVEKLIESGVNDGAKIAVGGKRPEGLERGYFFEPTLLTEVDNSWAIAQEEIFGPVAAVIGYDTDDEAVQIANDSRFGLSGAIFSRDAGAAYELALRIKTGQVHINGGMGTMGQHVPFGGMKRSGIGREFGEEGMKEYTQIKAITFHAG